MGFFTTLPSIWRFLQCLRRYRDTRNVFPHLVNGGKYVMAILSYVALSLYRVNGTHTNLALYITAALLNSIYACERPRTPPSPQRPGEARRADELP